MEAGRHSNEATRDICTVEIITTHGSASYNESVVLLTRVPLMEVAFVLHVVLVTFYFEMVVQIQKNTLRLID